jgi:hypothetical protein
MYGPIHPVPNTPSWHCARSVKHRENFTLQLNGELTSLWETAVAYLCVSYRNSRSNLSEDWQCLGSVSLIKHR